MGGRVETHLQHSGLTSAQVAERVAAGETNDTGRRTSRPVSDIVRANVLTRFNAIVGALAAVVLVTGHPQDALFGLVIVANTGIGVIQELRAKRTLDRLAVLGEEPVRVMRDGAEAALRPQDIVLDDWILIGPGDRVMVDGEVTDGPGMEVDESLLTGETDPVTKNPGDQLLSGSFVVSGSGAFTATRVGRRSYAAQLEGEASVFSLAHSELMAGINRFLRLITWVIVPVAILLTASQLAYASGNFPDAVAGAVAGIITMIPEGLVLLTSVAFAVGVVRLGRRRCLVQELPAIEVLARVDVLCLDKTGTLTEPGMELDQVIELAPEVPVRKVLASLVGAEERPNPTLQAIADGLADLPAGGDPAERVPARVPAEGTPAQKADRAPAQRAEGAPAQKAAVDGGRAGEAPAPAGQLAGEARWRPVHSVPFSSARKWSGAVFAGAGPASGGWILGAPDVLLPAGDPARQQAETKAADGLRVLVLGRADAADVSETGRPGADRPQVEATALLVLRQRLRAEASLTLAYFAEQDVAVKVISGDSAVSVGAIARQLGIGGADHPVDARTLPTGGAGEDAAPDRAGTAARAGVAAVEAAADVAATDGTGAAADRNAVTGGATADRAAAGGDGAGAEGGRGGPRHGLLPAVELAEPELAAVADALEGNSVFGRVSPRQKQIFVTALQSRGHTVAMTGDGINDVLALTRADLGVAMGSGSGATRAAAKIVLLDDSFATLPHVVAEGRRVLGNIERVASLFLTKTVYAVLLSIATAVVALAADEGLQGLRFPFLPRHLTLISTLTIGVPAFVLALAPTAQRVAPGFVSRVLRFAIPAGIACAAATFSAYVIARLTPGGTLVADRTTAVITLSATALWVLALVARPYTWWRIALVAAMAAGMVLALTIPLSRTFFDLRDLNLATDLIALAIAACAGTALTVFLALTHRLPGGNASEETSPAGH
ncbi:MAG TPA: HAD-IC family P-type ATPase [Streptosporangiaceae bacterium]|nr:HAD-IC family P-type ATPase [Streptosporangiaceae bacterium]